MANRSKPSKAVETNESGTVDPPTKVLSNAKEDPDRENVVYKANLSEATGKGWNALVDRGANGGIAGRDTRVLDWLDRKIDLSGIDDHTVRDLPLVTAGAVVRSDRGDILVLMHQYAHMADGKTIHSCGQMEWYKLKVQDKTMRATGEIPHIVSLEGYEIPLIIKGGLPYMNMRPPTDEEVKNLTRVAVTQDMDWDPSLLDSTVPETWYERPRKPLKMVSESMFDSEGLIKDELIPTGKENLPEEEEFHEEDRKVSRASIRVHLTKMLRPEEIVKEVRVFVVDGVAHEKDVQQQEARRKSPRLLQVPKIDYKDAMRGKPVEKKSKTPSTEESSIGTKNHEAKPLTMDRSPFEKPLE